LVKNAPIGAQRRKMMTNEQRIKFELMLEMMDEGCHNVMGEPDIHDDAKDLAKEVLKDCNKMRKLLEQI
jgi:hypothetical protein